MVLGIGALCDAFTPASLDVLHATCRAPGSGDEVTWGEFLRAVARAAELLDAPFARWRAHRRRAAAPACLPTPRQTAAATGATASANAAREDVRMIRPWEESLRREMRDGRGETLGVDGAAGGGRKRRRARRRAEKTASRVPGGAVAAAATIARATRAHDREPARITRGSLQRVGSHVPTILDEDGGRGRAPFRRHASRVAERSHRAIVARLERAERDAARDADVARMTRGVRHHEACRAALERSTRR